MPTAPPPELHLETPGPSSDYTRIERAIFYLRTHFLSQPDLAAIARSVHLSEFHFQRLFTRWAGVSPKRFIQYLTIEHAKRQLAAHKTVLDAACDSGLSSPSRLHDLFITVEALTPGEFKLGGAGVTIRWGFHPTRFGNALLAITERGICSLAFTNGSHAGASAWTALRAKWPRARFIEDPAATAPWIARIFDNLGEAPAPSQPLPLLLAGTNLQLQVWRALLCIPPGAVVSYQAVAASIGHPNASRAVGNAVGRNAIAYLIPCHRVIRQSGVIGEYRWGTARKQAMLGWESARMAEQINLR